jgi:outer membrane protein assembly factor BamE
MSAKHHFSIKPAALLVVLTALAGCSGFGSSSANPVNWITPYKIDVIQGNFISKEQVEALRAGMIRDQVKATLGTPLLASLFHADRWDYVFTLKRQGTEPQSYRYTVFFKGDLLERFEGDTMPSEAEFIARLDNKRKLGKVPQLEATEEQLKAAERPSKSSAANVPAAPATEPGRNYPPLEGPAN